MGTGFFSGTSACGASVLAFDMVLNMTAQAGHAGHMQPPGSYQLVTPPLSFQVPLAISREATPGYRVNRLLVQLHVKGRSTCDPGTIL